MNLFARRICRNGHTGLGLFAVENGQLAVIGARLRVGVPTDVQGITIRIGGGTGIQADIEAISALGGKAATVITCLTIQDTTNVESLAPIDTKLLARQIEIVMADYTVAAIKIGLIGEASIASKISGILAQHPEIPVIFDPVLAAGGGRAMAGEELIDTIRTELLPHTDLITPNSIEARRLSGVDELDEAAQRLMALGTKAVLVTGAHEANEEVINQLFRPGLGPLALSWPRLNGEYHGSGCTLASAIATLIAKGLPLEQAVEEAQQYTWQTLNQATLPGRGQAIPNRLNQTS